MLWTFLTIAAALLLVFLVYVALQPNDFRVARSATIAAPPDAVFRQVDNFHNWQQWSPWAKLDPNASSEFSGPDAGDGASFRWAGNREVGAGSMTIVGSRPNEHIRIRLDFEKPMAATSFADFSFTPASGGTQVSWVMSGKNKFISRLMCTFMNMDKMVGGQFEKGLANLAAIVEQKRV